MPASEDGRAASSADIDGDVCRAEPGTCSDSEAGQDSSDLELLPGPPPLQHFTDAPQLHAQASAKSAKSQRTSGPPFTSIKVEVPSDEAPWKPYDLSFTENAAFPCIPAFLYRARWFLMSRNPLCWYVWRGHTTLGDVIMFVIVWLLVLSQLLWVHTAFLTGTYASISLLFVFFFAMHNNQLLLLFTGMSFERALFWHKVCAVATVAHGTVHVLSYYSNGGADGVRRASEDHHVLPANRVPGMVFSGWLMLVSMAVMCLSGIPYLRRTLFAAFYRLHVVLAFIVVVGAFVHGSGAAAWDGRAPVGVLGGVLWLIDIVIRVCYMYFVRHPRKIKLRSVSRSNPAVVCASWPRHDAHFSAGQWVFLCVPKLGLLHWHPFTISSAPHDKDMTVHMAAVGPWTKRAAALAREDGCEIPAYIEGPYGAPMVDLHGERFQHILVVAGGMGVTFARAWKRQLVQEVARGRDIVNLRVVWSLRAKQAHLLESLGGWDSLTVAAPVGTSITEHVYLTGKHEGFDLPAHATAECQTHDTDSPSEDSNASYITDVPLGQRLHLGRPAYKDIFEEMARSAEAAGNCRVAVLVCGPQAIVDICRLLCRDCSTTSAAFEPHWEVFDF